MGQIFLTEVNINKVRHLENIKIPLSSNERKHLIVTGKNGSGKTSVLESMVSFFKFAISDRYQPKENIEYNCALWENKCEDLKKECQSEKDKREKVSAEKNYNIFKQLLDNWDGVSVEATSMMSLRERYINGQFVLAYYPAERKFNVETYTNIEKIELKNVYGITENPGQKLTKYLVDLKAMQAFSKDNEKIQKIEKWFERFENVLKEIFEAPDLLLKFDEETFQFSINIPNREPFDFNTMSSGYAAVFEIVNDLIIRMEAQSKTRMSFELEGIVLIDEIETHLHLELQKSILKILVKLFPNIQFVITTHSPFILSSLDNAVIYDLEKNKLVPDGLENLPYEGIVEGYFDTDRLSNDLRSKFERYKELVAKEKLTGKDYAEIEELEYYLEEIPDYLATEVTTEYSRLKLEFSNRG